MKLWSSAKKSIKNLFGNRKSKRRVHRRKTRKHKVKRGGGIGANCSDPNYSIFNTRLLNLFPYGPTK
jgi:hypothetical protein